MRPMTYQYTRSIEKALNHIISSPLSRLTDKDFATDVKDKCSKSGSFTKNQYFAIGGMFFRLFIYGDGKFVKVGAGWEQQAEVFLLPKAIPKYTHQDAVQMIDRAARAENSPLKVEVKVLKSRPIESIPITVSLSYDTSVSDYDRAMSAIKK